MSDHFNDPNFDSRKFNPSLIKRPPGINREEHERIVAAGLKIIGVKDDQASDVENLMQRAKESIKTVRAHANMIEAEHRAAGKDVNRKIFAEDILEKYVNSFSHLGKDELLMILVQFLTEVTVKETL